MMKLLIFFLIAGCNFNTHKVSSVAKVNPVTSFEDTNTIIKGEVKSGQGLYQALKGVNIDNSQALKLINQLSDEVEFSKLKVGDELTATFNKNQELIKFSFSQNLAETHILTLDQTNNEWKYSLKVLETFWQPQMIEGELKGDSTLESDLISIGLNRSVVNEVIHVLLCKVNFRMNAREGDKYQVLLTERKHKDSIIETKVLFTSYSGSRAGTHEAFYYEGAQVRSTYTAHYTESGQALISSGLRYPLNRLHVRSSYGWRRHPVTGRRAMHRGVDLRGKHGAKVFAVAAGKVVVSTFNEYAGNKVGIRHSDGSTSYYFHLSTRGVRVGNYVRSHQVIGRVGSTGRVTGAHLHFGFKKPNGRWMDPLSKRMIATPKLSGERFERLQTQIINIKGILADIKLGQESKYLVANLSNLKKMPSAFEQFNSFSKNFLIDYISI